MIAIINQNKTNEEGETLYTLQINTTVITTFWHKREEGFSKCLEKALKASKTKPAKLTLAYLQDIKEYNPDD